jgi:hypothetical protein
VKDGIETIDLSSLRPQTNANTVDPGELFCYNIINQQAVADKSIADCVEALIGLFYFLNIIIIIVGVYLLTYGPVLTTRFMRWFGLRVLNFDVSLDVFLN